MESSPVIGMNLGAHIQSHHIIEDLKKGRLAAVQKRYPKQEKSTKQTEPSEKLHELKKQAEQQTAEKPGEGKPVGKGDKYDDIHRVADGVKQKLCRKCKEWKQESEFHKNASCKDGLAGMCKVCKAKAARQYRERQRAEKRNSQ
jgi:hypothetical protein